MNLERGLDETVRFWSDVLNPMGYVELIQDPTAEKAKEQALHFAIKSGILTTGAGLVWALSGGGASMGMWFGASPPTAGRMFALKADTYRQMVQLGWSYGPQIVLVGSTAAQAAVWSEIGDPMTGAVHYSGAGTMSGGSMPVIPGDGGHYTTWFNFGDWWESL